MKKLSIGIGFLLVAACGSGGGGGGGAASTEYNYQTIQVTSIYTNWKKDQESAMQKADAEFGPFSKSACRDTIAKGWSLVEVVNPGEMNCEETPEGHHCRKKNAELKCQQVVSAFPS